MVNKQSGSRGENVSMRYSAGLKSRPRLDRNTTGTGSDIRKRRTTPLLQSEVNVPTPERKLELQPIPTLTSALMNTEQAALLQPVVRSRISLKDLCPEDKRRIAGLIQELARVSDEKDETAQRLRDEHQSFERKIHELQEQNQLIAQERESLQQQYRECQELLALYQQYLSQQQEKLSRSVGRKPSSNHKVSDSAAVSDMDGSYLPLSQRSGVRAPPCVQEATPNQSSSGSEQGGRQDSVSRMARSEPRTPLSSRAEMQRTSLNQPAREDWEERKRRLLLQKLELEMERERLQERLARQEEQLLRRNQRHRLQRLHAGGRSAAAADPERGASDMLETVGEPQTHHETQVFSRAPPTAPASHSTSLSSQQTADSMVPSTRDVATSPLSQHPQPVDVTRLPRTPRNAPKSHSLDSSLVDLLEMISPVSGGERSCQLKRQQRPSHAPVGSPVCRRPPEDPEESQMLEEIFFIC